MKSKILAFIAFLACMTMFGYVIAEQGDFSTLGYDTPNGYSFWRVDSSGYLKPGVASTLDIGTSALPVKTMYVGTITGASISSGGSFSGTSGTFTGALTTSGAFSIPSMSSTTIAASTPSVVGQLVYNTTRYAICVGTATNGAGYFIFQSSNPITISGVSCKE